MILVFLGPPGAGKGTQAKLISKELKVVHLSTGDLLRDQLNKENELSLKLNTIMENGMLVSDTILNQIVSDKISSKDCKKGFIFDGYPRTLSQAFYINDYFVKNGLSFNYFFEFHLDNDIIINRIINRASVESRLDDNKQDIIKTRLNKYYQETMPVLEHYKKKYGSIYHKVDANQDINKINLLLLRLLKK